MEVSPEMIAQAIKEEGELLNVSPAILAAQNQHLNNRVILLRALVNTQKEEIERLEGLVAKKSTSRQPTQTKKR